MPDVPESIDIPRNQVKAVADSALRAIGVPDSCINDILAVLMYAQERESTQGLVKIVERTVLPTPGASDIAIEQTMPGTWRVSGNGQPGMVVMSRASELVARAAASQGVAVVTTSGTASSSGAIGYYASSIAGAGLIGLVLAGSPPTTAVYGGVDPVLGTNPIAVALPGVQPPFVFDMATAAATVFGLIQARDANRPVDEHLAWDADGQPTTDPAAALAGAIRTFGGAKGSGLALVFEVLTRALPGAGLPDDGTDNRGNLLLAIDPASTVGRDEFAARAEAILAFVRNSRPASAGNPVRLPGEAAAARAQRSRQAGTIRVDTRVWQQLERLAGRGA